MTIENEATRVEQCWAGAASDVTNKVRRSRAATARANMSSSRTLPHTDLGHIPLPRECVWFHIQVRRASES